MPSHSLPTIALFGAFGRTGRYFLTKALAQGYRVRALVRTPVKLADVQAPELEIIAGDVLDAAAVRRTVQGCGVVVSVFGQVRGSPPDVQTRGTQNIVTAMQQQGIDKIISLSGGGLPCAQDQPRLADKLIRGIMKLLVPQMLTDAAGHADVLRGSGRRRIIARGPRLTNELAQGRYRVG